MNALQQVHELGQSIWIDFIDRPLMNTGQLQRLIVEDGIRGITSNPAIFEKAIGGSDDYDAIIRSLALQNKSSEEIYTELAIAETFRQIAERLDCRTDS